MQIRNSFVVSLPPAQAWRVLTDIPAIAPCLPGATLTGQEGNSYNGEIDVRLGPMRLNFKGRVEFVDRDDVNHTAKVKAQARDTKGRGGAGADVQFALTAAGQSSKVDITTEISLTGTIAQYGRGIGMINDLSNHLVGEFAGNLEAMLRERPASQEDTATMVEVPDGSTPVIPARAANKPISGFRLFGVMLKGLLGRLFSRRPSHG